ncbi:hypothetical protein VCHA53O466_40273 [Vibrio chagasii]|nr:hypothetical protein VCHA53O466_40273 [Vibrio chagasii]
MDSLTLSDIKAICARAIRVINSSEEEFVHRAAQEVSRVSGYDYQVCRESVLTSDDSLEEFCALRLHVKGFLNSLSLNARAIELTTYQKSVFERIKGVANLESDEVKLKNA